MKAYKFYEKIQIKISILIFSILLLASGELMAQSLLDSLLKTEKNNSRSDIKKLQLLDSIISEKYLRSQPDSASILANIMFEEATEKGLKEYQAKAKYLIGQIYDVKSKFQEALIAYQQAEKYFEQAGSAAGKYRVLSKIGNTYTKMNDYDRAFEYTQRSLNYHEEHGDTVNMGWDYLEISRIYFFKSNTKRAIEYGEQALRMFEHFNHKEGIGRCFNYLGLFHFNLGKYQQAIEFYQKSLSIHRAIDSKQFISYNLNNLGRVYNNLGQYEKALKLFYEALAIKNKIGDVWATSETLLRIGQTYQLMQKSNKAIEFCGQCLQLTSLIKEKQWRSETYKCLYQANKDLGRFDKAIIYNELYLALADTIARDDANKKLQQMEQEKIALQAKMEQEKKEAKSQQQLLMEKQIRNYFIFGFVVTLLFALLVFKQHIKIRHAFRELKSTQGQLIQAEKMASLGELTAGIAHEIQNPLNFVNNFSEVNHELMDELKEELDKGDIEEAKAISHDIQQNLEKINHHGKRAEAIVHGMLQHSRSNTGQKELTDINVLCDEYVRMAYHGMKAKEKECNSTFETHFDPNLPKIKIIPQDIGRVILNLVNNAFYSVNEKAKAEIQQGSSHYQPKVIISTKSLGDKIEIDVRDNGTGIPEHIKNKIFQPFFTTKPPGEGTGLGLSLSYDIITKGHGGELDIQSTPDNTIFKIHLQK